MNERGASASFLLFLLGLGICFIMLIFIMMGMGLIEDFWDFLRMLIERVRFW